MSRTGKTYVVIDIKPALPEALPEALTYVVLDKEQYTDLSSKKKTKAASQTVTNIPVILERQPHKKL